MAFSGNSAEAIGHDEGLRDRVYGRNGALQRRPHKKNPASGLVLSFREVVLGRGSDQSSVISCDLATPASSAIFAVSWLQHTFYTPETFLHKSVALLVVVIGSGIGFFSLAKLLRVEEADILLRKFTRGQAKRFR